MADSVHKTSQGKEIDLGKLMLKNEEVRAVGNMKVNARGDSINSDNKTVADRNKQVSKNYRKQIGNAVEDMPVMNSQKAAKIVAEKYVAPVAIEGLDSNEITTNDTPEQVEAPVEAPVVEAEPVKSGLAGAIAKAREVTQESNVDGVKKI